MPRVSKTRELSSNKKNLFLKERENNEKLDFKGKLDWQEFLEKNKISVAIGLAGVFLLGIGVLSAVVLSSKQNDSSIEILSSEETEEAGEIFVHVAGAVERPGLYKLSSGARVNDALVAAGGLGAKADREWFDKSLNLAQKLQDGIKLYIPFKGEGKVAGVKTSISNLKTEDKDKININTASALQLESLSGIGPSYAEKIIDYRNSHGSFAKIEDIMKIAGIGNKIFEKIKDQITVF